MENKGLRIRMRSHKHTTVDEDNISEISWPSRPSTREGAVSLSSASRLSSDSGAGSIEDFHRRASSPLPTTFLDYWDGVRRHTAPPRKTSFSPNAEYNRPNTVHAWDVYPTRSTLSRYSPLPAIGTKLDVGDVQDGVERPARKYCFQDNSELDSGEKLERLSSPVETQDEPDDEAEEDPGDDMIFQKASRPGVPQSASKLPTLNLESDSDFDEESESGVVCPTDDEEEETNETQKPRRPIVRSATFTIEDRKKEDEPHQPQQEQQPFSGKMLLAVRLPDGSRVSGYFDAHDSLQKVCAMATQTMDVPRDQYQLATTDVPKKMFSDFSITLHEAGIVDKTLLNLQLTEDDDSG